MATNRLAALLAAHRDDEPLTDDELLRYAGIRGEPSHLLAAEVLRLRAENERLRKLYRRETGCDCDAD